jgi:hypothetical protein
MPQATMDKSFYRSEKKLMKTNTNKRDGRSKSATNSNYTYV